MTKPRVYLETTIISYCRHLANAVLRSKIEDVCRELGYEPPVICTPQELMEE